MSRRPLEGVTVLDGSTTHAPRFCAKLLGDLGADVIRAEGPSSGGADASTDRLYLDTSKRSVIVHNEDELDRLIAWAAIIIVDGPAPRLEVGGQRVGLGELQAGRPDLIVTVVSPFGSDGPYRDYRANHLVLSALSGQAQGCGLPDREPLQAPGHLHELVSGAYAAVATLGALSGHQRHGWGDVIDVSTFEAAVTAALLPTLSWEYYGIIGPRMSDRATGPSFNIRCADGWVGVNILTHTQWELLCAFIGQPDLAEDPRFADPYDRYANADLLRPLLEVALAERSAADVFADAQEWRLPFGLVVSPAQILALEVHRAREFLVTVDQPDVGPQPTPRLPFRMSATPCRPGPSPRRGQHRSEELPPRASAPPQPTSVRTAPLAGVRIIDLTMFMSGPLVTLFCADLGAEVIKVESRQRFDGWRNAGRFEPKPWETAHCFNWINRTKRGITLNLADARGAALLRQLVASADALVENYTPRVMDNFGLGYDELRKVNPALVMLSMPACGTTGPWRDYAGFAWTTEQLGGLCYLTGYPGGEPLFSNTTGGDPLAGLMGGVALFAALHHQKASGQGQYVDLSQVETATIFIGDVVTAYAATGVDPGRRGNAHDAWVPHGMYQGNDGEWLAIACPDDAAWTALCRVMGAEGVPFPTVVERRRAAGEVDALVKRWVSGQHPAEAWHVLQAAGVQAGLVMNGRDLSDDEHLNARGFYLSQDREVIGVKRYTAQPFRFAETPLPTPTPAPYLGEHSDAVLSALCGCSVSDLGQLEADAVIGTEPLGVFGF